MILLVRHIILFAFLFTLNIEAQAKSHFDNLPADTQEDLLLVKRIASNPQLLNPKYLECYLGPKASVMTAPLSQSLRSQTPILRTFWLDRGENYTRYTLEQTSPDSNKFLAEFSFAITRPEDVLLKDMSKLFDEEPIKVLDESGHPTISFPVTDPTIKVLAYQDSHIINLTKIAIQYSGPILLPPTKVDMEEAFQYRRDTAIEHAKAGRHDKATSLLQSHLQAKPNDAEAHLQLADSYKARSCVNQAISEYKTALATCGDDKDIHDRCIEGLHALKVDLPNPSKQLPFTSNTATHSAYERININPPPINNSQPIIHTGSGIKSLEVGF